MKKFNFACFLLFSIITIAQQGINYKAVIKDGSGTIVANTSVQVDFIILDGVTSVYEETHSPLTDSNGIVIISIGEGAPTSGSFSAIDWSSNNHFLNVKIDTGGGLQDMGTTDFKTVPYALQSKTASTLPGGIDQAYIDALETRIATLELPPAVVGDLRAGGVVFWVDPLDNRHGLVCALSDYGNLVEWGCYGIDLPSVPNVISGPNGLGAEIGDGINNTNSILNDCPTAPAALAARSLGPEWFLPSANELREIKDNKTILEAATGVVSFNTNDAYWSSTEDSRFLAWNQTFVNGPPGTQMISSKDDTKSVRAVRAF